jgi:hypothetical protein
MESMAPGKLYVVTNAQGKVIGTARLKGRAGKGMPTPGQPTPMQGQKVHELDHSDELQKLTSAAELHQAVARLLKKR